MGRLLLHLFVPHHSNNHRAALLHNSNLLLLVLALFFLGMSSLVLKRSYPDILGISYSISVQELIALTNKTREEKGLPSLTLDERLSEAAAQKAQHMFTKNYWAHFADDGTTPWDFIKHSGYSYIYAGENLAKGFTHSSDIVNAWMNSQSHKDNILSDKYQHIGFAIVEGKLLGEETVLVVELFGSSGSPIAFSPQAEPPQEAREQHIVQKEEPSLPRKLSKDVVTEPLGSTIMYQKPRFEALTLSKSVLITLLSVVLVLLTVDFFVIFKRRIPRIVGHNLDHIMLITLFVMVLLVQRMGFTL